MQGFYLPGRIHEYSRKKPSFNTEAGKAGKARKSAFFMNKAGKAGKQVHLRKIRAGKAGFLNF